MLFHPLGTKGGVLKKARRQAAQQQAAQSSMRISDLLPGLRDLQQYDLQPASHQLQLYFYRLANRQLESLRLSFAIVESIPRGLALLRVSSSHPSQKRFAQAARY